MATIDMTHRKLNFPPRFLPYLEKHRIFELLHECVELLVQVKPRDHITFLKNVLPCAAMKKDKQRIVFFAPIPFDRAIFSELLASCLGIQNISTAYLEILTREKREAEKVKIEVFSESVTYESCICPGETELSYPGEMYYPSYIFPDTFPEEASEISVEEEEKTSEKDSCVCVCPCVKNENKANENKMEDGAEERGEEKQEGGEGGEGGEGEGEYPCIPDSEKKHKTKDSSYRPLPFTPQISPSSTETKMDLGLLADCELSAKGWILQDFPMTGADAELLNTSGVIPTHALRIIINEEEEEKNREYKANVKTWMKAYKYVPVLEIRLKDRNMNVLVEDMCSLLSLMPHRHAPMLPRVVLVGSRGSGVTTQGQKLAKKYGMVHVEFEMVMARALQEDDELCKMYKTQLATRVEPELEALLLERALLTSASRKRGWVLTGYPRNIDQMRMLDIIATPPNRVIFIEVPARECFVRLYYRKIDSCLGDEYKLPKIQPAGADSYETPDLDPEVANRLLSHPKNDKKQIIHDIENHFLNKKEMMNYCGRTASYVDGNQEVDRVFELIEQILINPAPPFPPRDPLSFNYGIDESYERLKKFRLASGMFFNNMLLNPPQ